MFRLGVDGVEESGVVFAGVGVHFEAAPHTPVVGFDGADYYRVVAEIAFVDLVTELGGKIKKGTFFCTALSDDLGSFTIHYGVGIILYDTDRG